MRFIYTWLVLCLMLCVSPVVSAAKISVETDLNPVVDEPFTLIFSSDEQPDGNPDFSPLNENFEVLGTRTSRNVQIINGEVSKTISWRLQAIPKSSGVVQIPPVKFGKDVSPATSIVVGKASATTGVPKGGIIVELESNVDSPYVQQQILITQRLLHVVSLRNTGATMSHPSISEGDALIQQLGGIINKTMLRNGIKYTVSERLYAVFPQASGKLVLGRTVFQGIINDQRTRRDPFGMSGRQVRRFSKPLVLDIQEQPAVKAGVTWLPASSVSVNAHWEVPPDQLKTGEPVTLTLAVIADGLLAAQLPELKIKLPKGLKGYSSQPEFSNNSNGASVIGSRHEKWILIGTAPGEYKLPEIRLSWWNLATGKPDVASTPETLVTVTGEIANSAATEENGGNTPESLVTEPENTEQMTKPSAPGVNSEELISPGESEELPDATDALEGRRPFSPLWLWLAVGLVVLVSVLAWSIRKRRAQFIEGKKRLAIRNRVNPLDLLEKACNNNEPQKAYDALSDWVKQDLKLSPATLSQLRKEGDFPLKRALDDLSMALYSSQHDDWQGKTLWQAVCEHNKQPQLKINSGNGLLSLYPE